MSVTTEAIYENGVLKLIQPIQLLEGTHVSVVITPTLEATQTKTPAAILAKIAALPLATSESEQFSGRNHDAVLYSAGNEP